VRGRLNRSKQWQRAGVEHKPAWSTAITCQYTKSPGCDTPRSRTSKYFPCVTGFLRTAACLFCSRTASARCDKGHRFPRPMDLAWRHGSDLFLLCHNHLSDRFKSPWLHKPNRLGILIPPPRRRGKDKHVLTYLSNSLCIVTVEYLFECSSRMGSRSGVSSPATVFKRARGHSRLCQHGALSCAVPTHPRVRSPLSQTKRWIHSWEEDHGN